MDLNNIWKVTGELQYGRIKEMMPTEVRFMEGARKCLPV